jgi:hypothetical protein
MPGYETDKRQFQDDAASLVARMHGRNPFQGGADGVLKAIRSDKRILHITASCRTNKSLVLMSQGLQFMGGWQTESGRKGWVLRILNVEIPTAEAFLANEASHMASLESDQAIKPYTWKQMEKRMVILNPVNNVTGCAFKQIFYQVVGGGNAPCMQSIEDNWQHIYMACCTVCEKQLYCYR